MLANDLDEFRKLYPVRQAFHSGRWGWRRCNGALNLNNCYFRTREEAEEDRDAFFERHGHDPYLDQ